MLVCKVGCDDFFEKGYIKVGKDVVQINDKAEYPNELRLILNKLIDKNLF